MRLEFLKANGVPRVIVEVDQYGTVLNAKKFDDLFTQEYGDCFNDILASKEWLERIRIAREERLVDAAVEFEESRRD